MHQVVLAESRNPASRFGAHGMRDPTGMVAEIILRDLAETLYARRVEVDFGAGLQTRSWYMDRLVAFLRFGAAVDRVYVHDREIQVRLVDYPKILVVLCKQLSLTYTVGVDEEIAETCRRYLIDVTAGKKWPNFEPVADRGNFVPSVSATLRAMLAILNSKSG